MDEMTCTWITLLPTFMVGAEDDGEGENEGDSEGDSEGDEGEGDNDSNDDDAGSDDDEQEKRDDRALKQALERERKNNKSLQRQLNKLNQAKADKDLDEQGEVTAAKTRAEKAEEKAQKLAAGLLKRDTNAAIVKAAEQLGFIDVDDAIAGVEIPEGAVDQDADDPTDIEIDFVAIKRAVKALATKKPHFLGKGTNDGEATGSNLRGGKKKSGDEQYAEKYPSLR